MDIRNYFSAKPGGKTGGGGGAAAKPTADKAEKVKDKHKRKMVISSSDEDEPKPAKKTIKDDDDDDFKPQKSTGSKTKSPAGTGNGVKSPADVKTKQGAKPTKLKEVNASEFFAKVSGTSKSAEKPILTAASPANKRKAEESFEQTLDSTSFSPQNQKKHRSDPSPSLSNKLAEKAKKAAETEEKPAKLPRIPKLEKSDSHEKPAKHEKRANSEEKSSQRSKTPSKSPKSHGHGSAKKETQKKTPKRERSKTPSREDRKKTPSKSLDESVSELPGTPQEEWEKKKEVRKVAYQKFLTRGGAKHPGSKPVPEGTKDCFAGLVFVLTGVYDSLEREEMAEIIKQYGGKVTSSVSKNTSYLVVGDEAGQSKLEKGQKLGTRTLTEDGLLDLIVQRRDPALLKEKENKTPSPEKVETKPGRTEKHVKTEKTEKHHGKTEKSPVKTEKVRVKTEKSPLKAEKVPLKTSPQKHTAPKVPKVEPDLKPTSKHVVQDGGWSEGPHETELWVEKYKPAACKNIIGQQGDRSNMNKLKIWLRDWNSNHLHRPGGKAAPKPAPWGAANDNGAWARCALLSGPPGVGKTTTAYLVAQELGFDIVEFNASDTRSKRLLQENVSNVLNTTSVSSLLHHDNKVTHKRVLLMDEVDGMAGNEDRGGIAELIHLLKTTKVPVIAMCNDRNHQKIRSLANHCFDLRFQRPRVEQIKAAMLSVCFKEKIKIKPEALQEIIIGCGQDVRQVLHHLSMIKAGEQEDNEKMDAATAKKEADMSKKTSIKMGPWDVCKKVFSAEEHKSMSFIDKSDLYFYDYNLAGLFVQENYLSSTPQAAKGNKRKTMELVSKAAESLAEGDIVERALRSGMNWSLLPTAAVFNSVLPGEYMSGFLHGQIQFPAWLGKNSRRNKIDRILQELQLHTRLTAGASKTAFNLDYSQALRDHITRPLQLSGDVDAAVLHMEKYALLREDLDGLMEVTQWPNRPDPLKSVESKTKAAFTRKYNKDNVLLPYSVVQHVKKKAKEAVDEFGDEDDEEVDEEAEDESIEADAMIKVKKHKG